MSSPPPQLFGALGRPAIAWTVILLVTVFTIASNHLATPDSDQDSQQLELILLRLQSQSIVGLAGFNKDTDAVVAQVHALNVGSVARRQRCIALIAELGGAEEARQVTLELDELLDENSLRGDGGIEISEAELAVQRILRDLFGESPDGGTLTEADHIARVALLAIEDRDLLQEQLGWIAGGILVPDGTEDVEARAAFLAPTTTVAFVMIGAFGLGALAGLAGFIILIVMAMLAYRGTVVSGLGTAQGNHGVYAETFAVWIVSFILLSLVGGMISAALPSLGLLPALAMFLASLFALRWPVFRGIPWESVKHDIGFSVGKRPAMEVLSGMGGYLGALPLLATGMMLTFVLLLIQSMFAPEAGPFDSAAGPAHPIVFQLAGSTIWLKLQVLLLASFAAPIVEETMFRGVLYRYLRETSRRFGTLLSVLISGATSSLVFAAIHPQGWVAIPALMALAFSFVLVREWRGSLLAAMIVHGISNGVVMFGLFLVLDMN